MADFKLTAPFKPTGDQPEAIEALLCGLSAGIREQTLLGVTGSGKTFTAANIIAGSGLPTLVLSHNKTLAAQLYEEFKRFFPENAVHYFVSYYDYYQPEAYIPQSDTYIQKDASTNAELDRLRHATTEAVVSTDDVIVVASVSAIYGIGNPKHFEGLSLRLSVGQELGERELIERLVELTYERNDLDLKEGTFRVRAGDIRIALPSGVGFVTVTLERKRVVRLTRKGAGLEDPEVDLKQFRLFPAHFWVTPFTEMQRALKGIETELHESLRALTLRGKMLEADRLQQRTRADLALMRETGRCHGIENYSRHLEFREPGSPPFTLIDYFNYSYGAGRWLLLVDESHQTLPQIRGMVRGDNSRKDTLIEHGFRLPSAKDNRPLSFEEFDERIGQVIFQSATPGPYEAEVSFRLVRPDPQPTTNNLRREQGTETIPVKSGSEKQSRASIAPSQSLSGPPGRGSFTPSGIEGSVVGRWLTKPQRGFVEQMLRPTGLLDPTIEIRPSEGQLPYLVQKIKKRIASKQRVLVTTLTKRLAEELTVWLAERDIVVEYLHSDVKTLERPEILHKLRSGEIDVLVGINLLREGLDLPEVSLIAILDADQEGFLRDETSLVQVMGRASRHVEGHVILFADRVTDSMRRAIKETERRRRIQERYNAKHDITPRTIEKTLEQSTLIGRHTEDDFAQGLANPQAVKELRQDMRKAARDLNFERAARIRDVLKKLSNQ